jgi:hypothetical protein
MRKIITETVNISTIKLQNVGEYTAIFVKKKDKLCGMIVKEKKGWIVRIGGDHGAYGHFDSLTNCILAGKDYGYEFYIV